MCVLTLTRPTHHWYVSYAPVGLRALPIINMHLCSFTLTNKRLTRLFFVLRCVFSIVRYGLSFKNTRKATGSDFIPLKVIRFASNAIDSHLYNVIIKDLETNKYSEEPKTALVRLIFKKNERNKIGNYSPVNIVKRMSIIYERCIHNNLTVKTILSNFISAYKKSYTSNHVLYKTGKNPETLNILCVLFLWISPRLLAMFLMIYLL